MAFTLHFQRRAQSLRTGEGVGLGGQGPSLACPGTLSPTPPIPRPTPTPCWVLSGSQRLPALDLK